MGDERGEDAAILRQLESAPDEAWDRLRTALTALEADAEPMTWGGGETETQIVDGVERRVMTMPEAMYTKAADDMRAALGGVGAVFVFDWVDWPRLRSYPAGAGLDDAPVADAVRLATAVFRSDRFSEGSYGGAIADGTVAAIARRLLAWHDGPRGGR